MIKLIVSDLDGTLLDHHKKVAQREIDSLRQVKEAGITLCLASGRMNLEMQQVLQDINHQAHSVSQNGAFIHLMNGTLLQSTLFEPTVAYEVFKLIQPTDTVQFICSGDANYIAQVTPAAEVIQTRMFHPYIVNSELEQAIQQDFPVCKFSVFGSLDILLTLKAQLEKKLNGLLDVYLSDTDCLDIMPHQVSKGTSLLSLLAHLDVSPEQIACVGDSFNDVSMFGITPHSFAMKSAHPDVKKHASYEVHSVSEAISHVLAYNEKWINENKGSTAL